MKAFLQVLLMSTAWTCRTAAIPVSRQARLSLADSLPYNYITNTNGDPSKYSFSYDVSDPLTGNSQYRSEERYPNGTVVGSYGYLDPFGKPRHYRYVADERGYRVMSGSSSQSLQQPFIGPSKLISSTESSITWTRPSKKKNSESKQSNPFLMDRFINRQHKPPSSFILYR